MAPPSRRDVASRSGYPPSRGGSSNTCLDVERASCPSCNLCHKKFSTCAFICACDCIFCEECTYAHFNESARCPACHTTLYPDDFIETVIADPSPMTEDSLKNAFQILFTKCSTDSNDVSFQEMCTRMLDSLDDEDRTIEFLLKQLVLSDSLGARRLKKLKAENKELKEQHIKLQQAVNSQRIESEQIIANLTQRLQAFTAQSSHSHNSRDLRSSRRSSPGSSHSVHSVVSRERSAQPPPPMQIFVENRKREELAKQASLAEMTRSRNVLGPQFQQPPIPQKQYDRGVQRNHYLHPPGASVHPVATPNPYSSHRSSCHSSSSSHRSGGGSVGVPIRDLTPGSGYHYRSGGGSVGVPIRDLTPGSGYRFTSRSTEVNNKNNNNKRPRSEGGYPSSFYGSPAHSLGSSCGYGRR